MSLEQAFVGMKKKPVKFNFLNESISNAGKILKTTSNSTIVDCVVQERQPVFFDSGSAKILYDRTQFVIYVPKKIFFQRDLMPGDTLEIDGKIYTAEEAVYRDEGGYTKIVVEKMGRR